MYNLTRLPLLLIMILVTAQPGQAHPTGNMVIHREHLLWSYVYPLDDPEHHACVMIWDKKSEPKTYIISEFPASDWMIYASAESLYLIERRYLADKDEFQFRVLKGNLSEKPWEIWPWTDDLWRTGEAGFIMESDHSMIFCAYPDVLRMVKGGKPEKYLETDQPVRKVKEVSDGNLLLLGESHCDLVNPSGVILRTWNKLLKQYPDDPPLNRNMIFDADYLNGKLVIAYWGNRSFELFSGRNERKILKKFDPPWAPHWVAFEGKTVYLFASCIEAGKNPRPQLLKYDEKLTEVWVEER